MELSSLDFDLIENLRQTGVLADARVRPENRRTVFVGCPDCDKLKDQFRHHGTQIGQKPHPIAPPHGGGAGFHSRSPLNGPIPFPWKWFCYKIDEAFLVKQTNSVAWYIHAPCRAAFEAKLNVAQLIELTLTNRGYFVQYMQKKHYRDGIQVTPYLHVDFTDSIHQRKIRRTYEIDIAAWIDFRHTVRHYIDSLPYKLPLTAAA